MCFLFFSEIFLMSTFISAWFFLRYCFCPHGFHHIWIICKGAGGSLKVSFFLFSISSWQFALLYNIVKGWEVIWIFSRNQLDHASYQVSLLSMDWNLAMQLCIGLVIQTNFKKNCEKIRKTKIKKLFFFAIFLNLSWIRSIKTGLNSLQIGSN